MRRNHQSVGLLIVLLLLVSSCGEQSNIDPDASVSVRGGFLDGDGSPLEDRPVRLGSGVTVAEGGLGVLTVGLSCFGGGCSGDFFDTTTDANGSFSFALRGQDTQSAFGEASSFLVSTSAEPPVGRPSGPAISARFRVQTTAVELPQLTLADARPELETGGKGSVNAAWNGSATPAPYTLTYLDQHGQPLWEVAASAPSAAVDGRVLEDLTGLAIVTTSRSDAIEGSDLDIVTRSSGVAFRGGFGPPPSRGARCEIRGGQGIVQPLETCPVTNADFSETAGSNVVCPRDSATASTTMCAPAKRVRVLLNDPLPAQLVVVRGCHGACRVAAVDADGQAADVGAVSAPFGLAKLDERPVKAIDIITDDVSSLTEVSIWPAVTVDNALFPVKDPADVLVDGSDNSGWESYLATAAAIALLSLAVLLLGILIGRRSRRPRPGG